MKKTDELTQTAGLEALEILRLMIMDENVTAAARVSAAKTLLDRMSLLDDDEQQRREAEERAAAIAEARCLLAELTAFATAPSARADQPLALAENSPAGTGDSAHNARR